MFNNSFFIAHPRTLTYNCCAKFHDSRPTGLGCVLSVGQSVFKYYHVDLFSLEEESIKKCVVRKTQNSKL